MAGGKAGPAFNGETRVASFDVDSSDLIGYLGGGSSTLAEVTIATRGLGLAWARSGSNARDVAVGGS